MTTLYGIKNCDTVKKARKWLELNGVDYRFHDMREDGIDQQQISSWIQQLGWETVVNKRSTSWKQLEPELRNGMDENAAIKAILANPTLVKRPLLDIDGNYTVGFNATDYTSIF